MVADALSRRTDGNLQLQLMSEPTFQLFKDLCHELQVNDELRALRDSVVAARGEPWHVTGGLIKRGARVFIPAGSALLPEVLQLAHGVGHEGSEKTLHRLRREFVVDHDRRLVKEFVRSCFTC